MSAVTTVNLRCDDCGKRAACRCLTPPAPTASEAREHAASHLHWVIITATDPVTDVLDVCPSCMAKRRERRWNR